VEVVRDTYYGGKLRIMPRAGLALHTYLVEVKLLVADHPHHTVDLRFLFLLKFFMDLAETEITLMVGVAIAN
jgi:hypothetical protein